MTGLTTIDNIGAGALVRLRPRCRDIGYRVVVLCEGVADVVSAAGGWLFDQGLAGCEVSVLLTSNPDDRALRILGAHAMELDRAMALEVRSLRPNVLAVAGSLFQRDPRVRHSVLGTLDEGLTHVMMWGDELPPEFEGLVKPVEYRPTIAARAFKESALAAAGVSRKSTVHTEIFRGVDLRACRSEDVDLVTAS